MSEIWDEVGEYPSADLMAWISAVMCNGWLAASGGLDDAGWPLRDGPEIE